VIRSTTEERVQNVKRDVIEAFVDERQTVFARRFRHLHAQPELAS